jgi:hypothetical protein
MAAEVGFLAALSVSFCSWPAVPGQDIQVEG